MNTMEQSIVVIQFLTVSTILDIRKEKNTIQARAVLDFLLTFFGPLLSLSKNDASQVETTNHQRVFNSFSRAVNQARDGLRRDDVVHKLG